MSNLVLQKNEYGNIESSIKYFLKFNIPKNAKILDVGCNYGTLIFNLYKNGYQSVYGIDINKKSIQQGENLYQEISERIKWYDGETFPFDKETFDVILMFDVIEHIPNVEQFFKNELYRVLKYGGLLIFQTPNKYINILWEIINQRSFAKWKKYHYFLQTNWSLKKLLIRSGFRFIKIEKNNILTEYNKIKVRRKMGRIGLPILHILQKSPLGIYPNLWGYCKK